MTLVLCAHSKTSLWVLTDSRLSQSGRTVTDDSVKLISVDALDGVGVVAYAGLGATRFGTQPSAWMAATLRGGPSTGSFEAAIGHLARAADKELPRHLRPHPGSSHLMLAPAFIRKVGPRFYTIGTSVDPNTRRVKFEFLNHLLTNEPGAPVGRHLAISGSGAAVLNKSTDRWYRPLKRLMKAHSRGRVTDLFVADTLAELNLECHYGTKDGSVGPDCVVVWRHNPEGPMRDKSPGHQFYRRVNQVDDWAVVPTIAREFEVSAIAQLMIQDMIRTYDISGWDGMASWGSEPGYVEDLLRGLPRNPDDRLR